MNTINLVRPIGRHGVNRQLPATHLGEFARAVEQLCIACNDEFSIFTLGYVLNYPAAACGHLAVTVSMATSKLVNPSHFAGPCHYAVLQIQCSAGPYGNITCSFQSLLVARMHPFQKSVISTVKMRAFDVEQVVNLVGPTDQLSRKVHLPVTNA